MLSLRVLIALSAAQLQFPYHPHLTWQFPSQRVSKSMSGSLLQPSARIRVSNYVDISRHTRSYLLCYILLRPSEEVDQMHLMLTNRNDNWAQFLFSSFHSFSMKMLIFLWKKKRKSRPTVNGVWVKWRILTNYRYLVSLVLDNYLQQHPRDHLYWKKTVII